MTKQSGKTHIDTLNENANEIFKNIIDKIFQSFFITKHIGQSAGLLEHRLI